MQYLRRNKSETLRLSRNWNGVQFIALPAYRQKDTPLSFDPAYGRCDILRLSRT